MGIPTGGANLGHAHGSITIDTSQAQQAVPVMAGVATGVERNMGKMTTGVNALSGAFNDLRDAMGLGFAVTAIMQVGRAINDMTEEAARLNLLTESYEDLAAGVGVSSEQMLEAMREASNGTINDANLILNANRAMVTGVADSTQEMVQLLEVARARAAAMGLSTQEAFQRITQGIGKREKEVLDELGIVINLNDVYDDYAAQIGKVADELSETEKTQAFFNAVLEDSEELLRRNAGEAGNAAEKIEQQKTAVDNLRAAIGDLFVEGQTANTDVWTKLTEGLTAYIRAIEGYSQLADKWNPITPFVGMSVGRDIGRHAGGRGVAPVDTGFGTEETQAMQEWAAERTEIETDANNDILEENNRYQQRRTSAIVDHEQTITRMGEDFARERARAEADYQQAVAEVHEQAAARELKAAEDLAKSIARLNADHAKQQQRWQRDLNESIAEAQEDSAERVADATADRDERIAEARADSTKRLADLEEEYTKGRERAARDHNSTILEAAANLDARAIWAEQRRYAQEQADAEDAHQEAVSEEQQRLADLETEQNKAHAKRMAQEGENLAERIAQEKKAHAQRVADANEAHAQRIADLQQANADQLAEAKEADGQRLEDMQAAHLAEQTEANTDYGIRLARMQEDHSDQLTEMATQHNNRITQIGTHAAEERDELDTEFEKRMTQLSGHEFDLETEQFKHHNRMLGAYQDYLDDMEREQTKHQIRMLRLLKETPGLTPAEVADIDRAITDLGETLAAIGVTPGRHVNPRTAPVQIAPGDQILVAGASFVMPAAGGNGGSAGAAAVTVEAGAIVIHAPPGMSAAGLGDEFERRLVNVLREVARM